jgi:hypothetical protein
VTRIRTRETERKRPFGIRVRRWEDTVKLCLTGFCEYGNEPSDSLKTDIS